MATALALMSFMAMAKDGVVEDYNRSSLYTFFVLHDGTGMYENIYETALNVANPERYNNHNLSMRILLAVGKPDDDQLQKQASDFLVKNQIAKRLVSKWFDRDKKDGSFNMQLIKDRGNYNATVEDVNVARKTVRGNAMLEDAGEHLLNNTFVIVNDITYVNRQARAEGWQAFFQAAAMIGDVASSVSNIGGSSQPNINLGDAISGMGNVGNSISSLIAGFCVHIRSYLYKLTWNDEVAGTFYSQYYYDKNSVDNEKKKAYDMDRNLFKLEYVGTYDETTGKTVTRGLHTDKDVFLKVLTRAVDENIVQLQEKFEVFKVTAPVYSVNNNEAKIHIGLKEGVKASSKYEVLERKEDADGKISYVRKGIIKPISGKIWDNRCMASEEQADCADLMATTFEKVSGADLYPGMLVREIE